MSDPMSVGDILGMLNTVREQAVRCQTEGRDTAPANVLAWLKNRYPDTGRSDEWHASVRREVEETVRAIKQAVESCAHAVVRSAEASALAVSQHAIEGFVPLNVANQPPALQEQAVGAATYLLLNVTATPAGHAVRSLPAEARVGSFVVLGLADSFARTPAGYRLPAAITVQFLTANARQFRQAEADHAEQVRLRLDDERRQRKDEAERVRLSKPLTHGDLERIQNTTTGVTV